MKCGIYDVLKVQVKPHMNNFVFFNWIIASMFRWESLPNKTPSMIWFIWLWWKLMSHIISDWICGKSPQTLLIKNNSRKKLRRKKVFLFSSNSNTIKRNDEIIQNFEHIPQQQQRALNLFPINSIQKKVECLNQLLLIELQSIIIIIMNNQFYSTL